MADLRSVTEYPALARHRAELRAAGRARRIRLAVALPLLGLTIFGAFSLGVQFGVFAGAVGAGVLFFLALPGGSSVDAGALAGIEGEVSVLDRLKALPDDYRIFNRVKVPDVQLPNGWRELDFIVSGPTGLWIVEVKNTPGHVYVQPDQRHWPLARRGCCGSRPNWNALENPIPQARAQADSLGRWLLRNGVAVEPRSLVCMAHPEVSLENRAASPMPILVRDELVAHIRDASRAALPGGTLPALAQLHPDRRSSRDRAA
ncbi:MAG: nuclease-related domain-containing protein [Wenzhouxiangellaceae bacterium]|nr:nuclease-related domain-containing protein [Wenzhouxiangellaceae bacterium]